MNTLIDAASCIRSASWLPDELQAFLIEYSVAVNHLITPFPEDELIFLMRKHAQRVSHIVIAYEVPPGFTRRGQYSVSENENRMGQPSTSINPYTPGLYGIARGYRDSMKIILFMRENILQILREKNQRHVKGAFEQFQRLRSLLSEEERSTLHPFSLVGVLPGRIIAWGTERLGAEYAELVDMARMTNANSSRFVKEAVLRTLSESGFAESDLIILGSEGVLGKEIRKHFPQAKGFDLKLRDGTSMDSLLSSSSVILDCTNGEGLENYVDAGYFSIGKRYIWIVESYPVPSHDTLQKIQRQNLDIRVLHIKGVGSGPGGEMGKDYGNIIPFPVYGKVMPCCTATLDEPANYVITGELYGESKLG